MGSRDTNQPVLKCLTSRDMRTNDVNFTDLEEFEEWGGNELLQVAI